MSRQLSIAFVAANDGVLRRMPEVLAGEDTEIRVVGPPGSVLASSSFVTSVSTVGDRGEAEAFTSTLLADAELLRSLPKWTLWGSDAEMFAVARSDLDLGLKLEILPVRRQEGLKMLGSKVGLALTAAALGITQPRSLVLRNASELAAGIGEFDRPTLIKGDQGGGGARVRETSRVLARPSESVPADWYPLLLQEFIVGDEVSVEALFGEGRLLAWQYSTPVILEGQFGRTVARDFVDPSSMDFVKSLQVLAAECGLHGFANCTFIRAADSCHQLVEVDMRANAWHQFGPQLGVDWRSLMLGLDALEAHEPVHPEFGKGRKRRFHLYPRELAHAFSTLTWSSLAPWVRRSEGTWDTRNRTDPVLNRIERRVVLHAASRLPAVAWRRLRSG